MTACRETSAGRFRLPIARGSGIGPDRAAAARTAISALPAGPLGVDRCPTVEVDRSMRPDLPALALLSAPHRRHGRRRQGARPAQLHARQRPDGRRHRGPPRPGGHPDGLVPGRIRRRSAGQSGTAHFLEHLMFKATDKLAEGEFDRTVEENGGTFQAFTSTRPHRLRRAHRGGPARSRHGHGSRSHGEPRADRGERPLRARRGHGGTQAGGRRRSRAAPSTSSSSPRSTRTAPRAARPSARRTRSPR